MPRVRRLEQPDSIHLSCSDQHIIPGWLTSPGFTHHFTLDRRFGLYSSMKFCESLDLTFRQTDLLKE